MFHGFHKDKDTEVIHRFMHNFKPRPRQSDLRPSEIMVLMMISHYVEQNKSFPFPSQISKALNLSRPPSRRFSINWKKWDTSCASLIRSTAVKRAS
jgi:hypothetical protein